MERFLRRRTRRRQRLSVTCGVYSITAWRTRSLAISDSLIISDSDEMMQKVKSNRHFITTPCRQVLRSEGS